MGAARTLYEQSPKDGRRLEAVGWLLQVMSKDAASQETVEEIHQWLNNRVTETAAGAHFVSARTDDAHLILHSNRRADGVLLDALIASALKSDLVPKLVRGLLCTS